MKYVFIENHRIPFVGLMNYFSFGDPTLYADSYSYNLDHAWLYLYLFINVATSAVTVAIIERLAKTDIE